MNSKEKAWELYNKYRTLEGKFGDKVLYNYDAKQCALIAVDESINILDEICKSSGYDPFESPLYDLKYWKEVKQKIEKL